MTARGPGEDKLQVTVELEECAGCQVASATIQAAKILQVRQVGVDDVAARGNTPQQ